MSVLRRSLLLAALLTRGLSAQDRALPDRLGAASRATLDRLIDSARVAGLPRGPLYDKVSEGLLKGADDERIVRAVQSLARELGDARSALGTEAPVAVLSAGASAIHAGVPSADLRRIAHPAGATADPAMVTTALVTLVDLVVKRVPVALATSSIQSLMIRHATEKEFSDLRSGVEQDVLSGRAPEASVTARVRIQLGTPPQE